MNKPPPGAALFVTRLLQMQMILQTVLQKAPSGVERVKVKPDGAIIINQQEEVQSLDSSDDEDGATPQELPPEKHYDNAIDLILSSDDEA
jgi:hypothetical protein